MNILTQCPNCKQTLNQVIFNPKVKHDRCKNRCALDYCQFYDVNDNSIGYFNFDTQDFRVYVFYNFNTTNSNNVIKIYHKIISRTADSDLAFILPRFEIDWTKLDYYNKRWKLWKPFS